MANGGCWKWLCVTYLWWLMIQSAELFPSDGSLNEQDLFFFQDGVSAGALHQRVMAGALAAGFSFVLVLQGCRCTSLLFLKECWEIVWVGAPPSSVVCRPLCDEEWWGGRKEEGIWFCRFSVLCPEFGGRNAWVEEYAPCVISRSPSNLTTIQKEQD